MRIYEQSVAGPQGLHASFERGLRRLEGCELQLAKLGTVQAQQRLSDAQRVVLQQEHPIDGTCDRRADHVLLLRG
ncbi:MAG: hypothetical protein JWO52_7564 [Gammaproteobacteria bacterium]|nr:hypothetical protein [Gammaproteobacteria bacterium]